MPQQRGDLATMGRLRRASMKPFLGLCEINLKQMTDLLGLLAHFHMGVYYERSYCPASATCIGIVGRRSRRLHFNVDFLWDRLTHFTIRIDPGSIPSG
jgi:hypothetical protein